MMRKIRFLLCMSGTIFLFGCSPGSLKDLQLEAEVEMKKLCDDLQKIESEEDFEGSYKSIKNHFNDLAEILGEAQKFSKEESEISFVGEQLFLELARIYEMNGGKSFIERAQKEAARTLVKAGIDSPQASEAGS